MTWHRRRRIGSLSTTKSSCDEELVDGRRAHHDRSAGVGDAARERERHDVAAAARVEGALAVVRDRYSELRRDHPILTCATSFRLPSQRDATLTVVTRRCEEAVFVLPLDELPRSGTRPCTRRGRTAARSAGCQSRATGTSSSPRRATPGRCRRRPARRPSRRRGRPPTRAWRNAWHTPLFFVWDRLLPTALMASPTGCRQACQTKQHMSSLAGTRPRGAARARARRAWAAA